MARHAATVILLAAVLLAGCRRPTPTTVVPDPTPIAPPVPATRFKDCNVVFVSFDALQAAHVSHLGYDRPTTPALDELAQWGFKFTNAYSVASWTVPASMTWFTGVYPSEHRMTNKFAVYTANEQKIANLKDLAPNLVTLAQVFKRNGYVTGGFTGNAGVSGGFGYELGFDEYYYDFGRFGGFDQSVPRALEWVKKNKDKRFFLFLHGYDCHGQNAPPAGFDYRFAPKDYDQRYTGTEQEQEVLREEGLDKGKLDLRDVDVQFWRGIYDEKIQRADAKFKQFLDEYQKLNLTGRTVFIVTSDHGTEFAEHGRFDHGFTLYDEQLHVPLIIKTPGPPVGKAITDRVSSIDVMPTILELVDLDVPADARQQMRGRSLVPALKGETIARDVFSETDYRMFTFKRSIIAPDGWKLIYTAESQKRELYDLANDPGEQYDLAAQASGRADELQRRLFAHFQAIGHDLTKRKWERGFNPVYSFPKPAGKNP